MGLLLSLFLLALTVKEDHALLKSACGSGDDAVVTLRAGAPVAIRFGLSADGGPCYKVSAQVNGKTVEGYLPASAIDGLEEYDSKRRSAAWVETEQVMHSADRLTAAAGGSGGRGAGATDSGALGLTTTPANQAAISEAARLIEASQPEKALERLEPELKKKPDAGLLAIAGVAAWRADDSRGALEYWRRSLELSPNPSIERLSQRVERETANDKSSQKVYGLRVVLRYDNAAIDTGGARQMLAFLDDEFLRISTQLGCSAPEKIVAIVQSREAYRKATDAAEWNGGQFDGRIRVPVVENQGVDGAMQRMLAHEITHACLSMMGRWPAWLQEGMAQRFSGDALSPAGRKAISDLSRQGKIPRLANLRQDWSRMDSEHATAAYALSLAAVDLLYETYNENGVWNVLHNPDRLETITADLDKRLGL
ncbi:MAG TPA: hypothetical protein VGJ09_00700 [Bryobacteraceae bacterium]|jgi:tetratricopeptide (TPR) repeat protein